MQIVKITPENKGAFLTPFANLPAFRAECFLLIDDAGRVHHAGLKRDYLAALPDFSRTSTPDCSLAFMECLLAPIT